MVTEKITATSVNRAMLKAKKMFEDDAVIIESNSVVIDGKKFYELTVSGTKVKNNKKESELARKNASRVLEIINDINGNSQKNNKKEKNVDISTLKNDTLAYFLGDNYKILSKFNLKQLKIYKKLIESGITIDIASAIVEEIFNIGFYNEEERDLLIEKLIYDNLTVSGNLYEKKYDRRIVSLIGTSGVGKTTTLAKIVSEAMLSYNKKVALFTFDNYRKSTLLQLKLHADILKVPFETIKNKDNFQDKLLKYSDYDLILLDMEGVNIFDEEELNMLGNLLDINGIEKHLTIPVTMSEYNQEIIFKKFKKIAPDYLIFTRLDETDRYSSILNLNLKTDLPVSYFTTGPSVSGGLFNANKRKLSRFIVKSIFN